MKKLLIVFAIAFLSLAVNAQPKLPGQCEVWLPKSIDTEVVNKKDAYAVVSKPYGQTPIPAEKNYWIVFSDRDDNTTYVEPRSGAASYTKLAFNERLIIASIKNDYALVYSEPKTERYPYISSAAVSKGWVPLSHLLLWTKGLADDADISYKAVICVNLDVKGNNSAGWLYKNPKGKSVEKLKSNMRFYFIMKEEGNKVLLGNYASLKTDSNIGLFGWVDNNSFVPWNQRTCLEPTWNHSDVQWFSGQNKKWQVFSDKDKMKEGNAVMEGAFDASKTRDAKDQYAYEYKYRTMPPRELRYPILDGSTNQLYHCSSFGTLGKKVDMSVVDKYKRAALENLNNTKVINIGIVIDGTSSMKPYFASVKDAIVQGCKYFAEKNYQVNVAVSIYRDKEDEACVVETFPSAGGFTDNPNNQNLKKFLDTGGKCGVGSDPKDKDEKESVYYGIKTAVGKFNFNPEQSNLLLVVGDCGDNGKMGVKREEIIDLLAEKKISLMAFQVRNKDTDPYQTFNTQMTYIMKQSLQKRFDNLKRHSDNLNQAIVISAVQMKDGSGWDIYNVNANNEVDIYRYVHRRNPALNKDMDVTELTSLMEKTIGDWKGRIQALQDYGSGLIDFGFEPNNDGNGLLKAALIEELCDGNKDMYKKLVETNSLISFRGIGPKKAGDRNFYKVVVFLPDSELKKLIQKLQPVYNVAKNRSNDRRPYYDAMRALASSLVAQDEIKDIKYKEVIAKVFGLDNATTDHGGPSLADIVDPNVVSQAAYLDLVNKMVASYDKLKTRLSSYPFTYESAGSADKYYWIPIEDLPL